MGILREDRKCGADPGVLSPPNIFQLQWCQQLRKNRPGGRATRAAGLHL